MSTDTESAAPGVRPCFELVCPADMNLTTTGDAAVVVFAPTVVDRCGVAPRVTCDPPSGSAFPVGTTIVTCRAIDAQGTSVVCRFQVTVARERCYRFLRKPTVTFTGMAGTNAGFTLTVALQNLGGVPVHYLYLVASQACVAFPSAIVDLTQPPFGGALLASNAVRTLTVPFQVAPGCASPHEVLLGLFDTDFRECCARSFLLPGTDGLVLSLRFGVTPTGRATLGFATEAGRTYRVESAETLGEPTAWDLERSLMGDGSEAVFEVDPRIGAARFFRVLIP